jgi:hypothetical protein
MNLKKLLSLQNTQGVCVYYIYSFLLLFSYGRRGLGARVLGIKEVRRYDIK